LTVYFELSDSFDEVTDFVKDLVKIYDLNLKVLGEFKEGLTHIKVPFLLSSSSSSF